MSTLRIEDLHIESPPEPVDGENWDLETWRKEMPMDYFKAMAMLNMTDNNVVKSELFKAIYRVIRLHVPDILYKYYPLYSEPHKINSNKKKLQTLMDGKIYMSSIDAFNDPFDGKGFFYDPSKLADIDRLKACGGKLIDDFNAYIRAASLTANGVQSMPMWAHYAANHKGYCVAYDMKTNINLSSNTFPVQYTNERLDVTSLMVKQAYEICDEIERQTALGKKEIHLNDLTIVFMASLLYNLKHTSWSYEKEFRCTIGATAIGVPYIEAMPKEIYIGMNCDPEYAKRLSEIASHWKIPIYKMAFEECAPTYELSFGEYKDN